MAENKTVEDRLQDIDVHVVELNDTLGELIDHIDKIGASLDKMGGIEMRSIATSIDRTTDALKSVAGELRRIR
jgi:dihydroxyacetone kinase DhaKLM complex PTS-EIIA-like component DhaM